MIELKKIADKIHAAPKYKIISHETILNVLTEEFHRHKSIKIAEEISKQKLHRIRAFYLGEPNYKKVKESLIAAFSANDDVQIQDIVFSIFSKHQSARERNELLDNYYSTLFERAGFPNSIADLACALNPLSFRWMGLSKTTRYFAYDVNLEFIDLINFYFQLEGLEPLGIIQDVYCSPVVEKVDLAFLFKMYYCLEHRKRGAGWEVVESVNADKVAISFPTLNLVSKKTDILGNYEEDIISGAAKHGWGIEYITFPNEIITLIIKNNSVIKSI